MMILVVACDVVQAGRPRETNLNRVLGSLERLCNGALESTKIRCDFERRKSRNARESIIIWRVMTRFPVVQLLSLFTLRVHVLTCRET